MIDEGNMILVDLNADVLFSAIFLVENAVGCKLGEHCKRIVIDHMLDYIRSFSAKCRNADKVVIELISDASLDEEKIRRAFKIMLEDETEKLRQEKIRNNIKQLWMFGIGCLFILMGLLFGSHVGELTAAILSTIGSFSLWEAAAIWIVENPQSRLKRRWLERLKHTELTFTKQ